LEGRHYPSNAINLDNSHFRHNGNPSYQHSRLHGWGDIVSSTRLTLHSRCRTAHSGFASHPKTTPYRCCKVCAPHCELNDTELQKNFVELLHVQSDFSEVIALSFRPRIAEFFCGVATRVERLLRSDYSILLQSFKTLVYGPRAPRVQHITLHFGNVIEQATWPPTWPGNRFRISQKEKVTNCLFLSKAWGSGIG
jgi:hypothetical protein